MIKRLLIWAFLITFLITFHAIGCVNKGVRSEKNENETQDHLHLEWIGPEYSGIDFNNRIVERYEVFFEFFPYVYNGAE